MRGPIRNVLIVLSITISLMACANDSDVGEGTTGDSENSSVEAASLDETSKVVGKLLNESVIEEELTYIETLVGIEELQAAKTALEGLLSELNGPIGNEEQLTRINELKTVLSEVEVSEEDSHDHAFTGVDAVALAMERYGADDEDIVYMYDDNHEHYGEDQIGYYVALKSKTLQEQEGGDGIVLLLFVGDDGSIVEL